MQRGHTESTGGFIALLNQGAAFAPAIPMPKIGSPPPTEIKIFGWGKNQTTQGLLILDQAGAQTAVASFAAKGNAGVFDLWHSMFNDDIKPTEKETVGYYRLEIRGSEKSGAGGLYAVGCTFIPEIAAAISAGKWPYISPAAAHTKVGSRIVGIHNLALVGLPATHNAQPLLLSLLSLPSSSPKKANTMKTLRTVYGTGQRIMRDLKMLADSGEQSTRDFASKFLAAIGPLVADTGLLLGDQMPTDDAMLSELSAEDKGAELIATLAADFGTSDPEKIEGLITSQRIRASAVGTQAAQREADQKEIVRLLSMPEHSSRIPAADLVKLKTKPLGVVTSLLADLKDKPALPGVVAEAEPVHATRAAIEKIQPGSDDEVLTLAKLTEVQLSALDGIKAQSKKNDPAAFDEKTVETVFLSTLSAVLKGGQ